jgi:hypothetical protein
MRAARTSCGGFGATFADVVHYGVRGGMPGVFTHALPNWASRSMNPPGKVTDRAQSSVLPLPKSEMIRDLL